MAIPYFNNTYTENALRDLYARICGRVGNNLRRAASEHDSPYWGFFPAGEKPRARTQSVSCHRPGNPLDRLPFFAALARSSSSHRRDRNRFSRDFPATKSYYFIVTMWNRSGSNPPQRLMILFLRMSIKLNMISF